MTDKPAPVSSVDVEALLREVKDNCWGECRVCSQAEQDALEKDKQFVLDGIRALAAENERLRELCARQQSRITELEFAAEEF